MAWSFFAVIIGFVLGRWTDRSYYAGFRHAHALCHPHRCHWYRCRAARLEHDEDPQ